MPDRPAYRLYRGLWSVLDLFFPPSCAGCDTQGIQWCPACQDKVVRLIGTVCKFCGAPLDKGKEGICQYCQNKQPFFTGLRSYALFEGPIRKAIHRLKYGGEVSLGVLLAEKLTICYRESGWKADTVIPVPLGVARLRERGYNQAALLARPLALELGIPFQPAGLMRIKETRSQVGLSYEQRRENVQNAFIARKEIVAGKKVLIVDDVATTSATIDTCAQAILSGGACEVYGLTVARAGLSQHNADQL